MSFSIEIDRKSRKVLISLISIKKHSKEAIRQSYYDLGKSLVRESKKLILDPPKTGKVYRIKRNVRTTKHRSSSPGEAPANMRGNLWKSINFTVQADGDMEFGSEDKTTQGKDVNYGGFLELGTSKISPRPYLITAIKNNQQNAKTYFEKNLMRSIKKDI
jgi:hypothetical protein